MAARSCWQPFVCACVVCIVCCVLCFVVMPFAGVLVNLRVFCYFLVYVAITIVLFGDAIKKFFVV